jgi:glycosyltransferase involved in cell wall biosynthesis
MDSKPLISIITPFYNTPHEFFREAVQSVFEQSYHNWELILIDDGSTGSITQLAVSYATQNPEKVYYYEHTDHLNRGHSTARNLGIKHSKGKYIAFLDADDVWMPHKLEQQAAILESHPDVGMIYANTRYWFSWTNNPKDSKLDFLPALGIQPDTVVQPPNLLPLFLNGKAAVPSMNTLLVRSDVVNRCGGFDERFRSLYGDQHFYAKVCLFERVYVSGEWVDLYRQHSQSTTGKAYRLNTETRARKFFLQWLEEYMNLNSIIANPVRQELRREMWRISLPDWLPDDPRLERTTRWFRKWILRMEEQIIPPNVRTWLWTHK